MMDGLATRTRLAWRVLEPAQEMTAGDASAAKGPSGANGDVGGRVCSRESTSR